MASSDDEFTTAILGLSMSSALRPSAFQLARRLGELALRLRSDIERPFFGISFAIERWARRQGEMQLNPQRGTRQWGGPEGPGETGLESLPAGETNLEGGADTSLEHAPDGVEQHVV